MDYGENQHPENLEVDDDHTFIMSIKPNAENVKVTSKEVGQNPSDYWVVSGRGGATMLLFAESRGTIVILVVYSCAIAIEGERNHTLLPGGRYYMEDEEGKT